MRNITSHMKKIVLNLIFLPKGSIAINIKLKIGIAQKYTNRNFSLLLALNK